MKEKLQQLKNFLFSPTHSRTLGVLLVLILIVGTIVTVQVLPQQTNTQQHAMVEGGGGSTTTVTCSTVATGAFCTSAENCADIYTAKTTECPTKSGNICCLAKRDCHNYTQYSQCVGQQICDVSGNTCSTYTTKANCHYQDGKCGYTAPKAAPTPKSVPVTGSDGTVYAAKSCGPTNNGLCYYHNNYGSTYTNNPKNVATKANNSTALPSCDALTNTSGAAESSVNESACSTSLPGTPVAKCCIPGKPTITPTPTAAPLPSGANSCSGTVNGATEKGICYYPAVFTGSAYSHQWSPVMVNFCSPYFDPFNIATQIAGTCPNIQPIPCSTMVQQDLGVSGSHEITNSSGCMASVGVNIKCCYVASQNPTLKAPTSTPAPAPSCETVYKTADACQTSCQAGTKADPTYKCAKGSNYTCCAPYDPTKADPKQQQLTSNTPNVCTDKPAQSDLVLSPVCSGTTLAGVKANVKAKSGATKYILDWWFHRDVSGKDEYNECNTSSTSTAFTVSSSLKASRSLGTSCYDSNAKNFGAAYKVQTNTCTGPYSSPTTYIPTTVCKTTTVTLNVKLPGIGTGDFENKNPAHQTRNNVGVVIFDQSGNASTRTTTTLTYNSSTGLFVSSPINVGVLPYTTAKEFRVYIGVPQFLKAFARKSSSKGEKISLTSGVANTVTVYPLPGDIVDGRTGNLGQDDVINGLDYNILRTCRNQNPTTPQSMVSGNQTITFTCGDVMNFFDYPDGGTTGDEWSFNYNLWVRSLVTACGQTNNKCTGD
ncbi:MAG TPA: hypothetical protein VLB73_00080 [Patescibacteria group bacterium]|nr:hypothetical protein [Patescibacteria group bacterium]